MFGKTLAAALLLSLISSGSAHATTDYQILWQASFAPAELDKLSQWLAFSANATATLLGPYPFTTQLIIHRRAASEPVPWANTWRESAQQVHFYVDPRFSSAEFIQDWTAYHEIAHLALPYLGVRNAWFSEGFASYMQYHIMQQAGVIDSAADAISAKFSRQRQYYLNNNSMRGNAMSLFTSRRYAAAYWGGAQFFVIAEQQLQQQGKATLAQLVKAYQQCCRLQDQQLEQVIAAFDQLSDSTLFSNLLQQFSQQNAIALLQQYNL
jgi:hypothetical protein